MNDVFLQVFVACVFVRRSCLFPRRDAKFCGTVVVRLYMMTLTWVMPGDDKTLLTAVVY